MLRSDRDACGGQDGPGLDQRIGAEYDGKDSNRQSAQEVVHRPPRGDLPRGGLGLAHARDPGSSLSPGASQHLDNSVIPKLPPHVLALRELPAIAAKQSVQLLEAVIKSRQSQVRTCGASICSVRVRGPDLGGGEQ